MKVVSCVLEWSKDGWIDAFSILIGEISVFFDYYISEWDSSKTAQIRTGQRNLRYVGN